MGYAQIAGLPAAYGLYGSLLPVLVYAFTTSSPQFVFGVDATPAVLVGGTLAALGVTTGSDEAMRLVPAITLVVAAWLDVYKRQILYSSWIQANTGSSQTTIDIAKVSCILWGIMFIVLGNFMTKAKRNAVVGLRTVWSCLLYTSRCV